MRRRAVAAALALAAASSAAAQLRTPVEIVDWGLIERAPTTGTAPSDTLVGRNWLIDPNAEVAIAERTADIPGCIGVRFGILFRAVGLGPDERLPVTVTVTHPEQVAPDGRRSTVSRWNSQALARTLFTGWRFEEPYEIVDGDWTISLSVGGRLAAQKTFRVSKRACALQS